MATEGVLERHTDALTEYRQARAALVRQGWIPCERCGQPVAPIEGERGPVVCAACERKHTHKRGAA